MVEVTYDAPDGLAAAAVAGQLADLYAEVYAEPPYDEGPEHVDRFVSHFAEEVTRDGFTMVQATCAGELVGVAYGWTMPPGQWWGGSREEPPAELHTAAKAALKEWFVRRPARGRGVGGELLRRWLADRREPWAVLASHPDAPARRIYAALGWRQVGTSQPAMMPEMDLLALRL